ncbi:MAG: MAPEG family protein [Parvibaculaceae bacterium]
MTIELWMLIASVILAMVMTNLFLFGAMRRQWGLAVMLGNRENLSPLTGWGGRLSRAINNLMDNITLFGAIVLVAHVAGISNQITEIASMTFFASRVGHGLVYTLGFGGIRTVIYTVGWAANIVFIAQLFLAT